jgi:hypothetical protein
MTYLFWICPLCHDEVISISGRHHTMDSCRCGKSFVDYEEYLLRVGSDYYDEIKKSFEEIDYNFFDELLLDCQEQEFEIPSELTFWAGCPIKIYNLDFIRKLEDEMLDGLKND